MRIWIGGESDVNKGELESQTRKGKSREKDGIFADLPERASSEFTPYLFRWLIKVSMQNNSRCCLALAVLHTATNRTPVHSRSLLH